MTGALAVFLALTRFQGLDEQPDAEKVLKLTVTVAKQENTLYEPVVFRIVLQNAGPKPVVIASPWIRDMGLQVQIAEQAFPEDGLDRRTPPASEFGAYLHGVGPADGEGPAPREFHPGDRLEHVEATLWYWHDKQYFMKSPGLLWIKARYRYARKPDRYVESAPVAVRFDQVPQRDRLAAQLWATAEVASVVQYGTASERAQREKAKRDLEMIVAKHPNSVYAFYAWHALKPPQWRTELNRHETWVDRAFEDLRRLAPGQKPDLKLALEWQRIREERDRRPVLFPEDERLDQDVTFNLRKRFTPLEELLRMASEQSGVTLRSGPELRNRGFGGPGKLTRNLRAYMSFLQAGYQAKWIPDGDGYLLTTKKDGPIDNDTDANDVNEADNIGGAMTAPSATKTTDNNGLASVDWQTAHQPGANYRIAVAGRRSELDTIKAYEPYNNQYPPPPANTGLFNDLNGDDLYQPTDEGPILDENNPTPSVRVTPMLTVWRRLYVEIDLMKAPAGDDITQINATNDDELPPLNGAGDALRVPDTGLLQAAYGAAFIQIAAFSPNPRPMTDQFYYQLLDAFDPLDPGDVTTLQSIAPRDSLPEKDAYWTVYVVSAYEFYPEVDNDPNTEDGALGYTLTNPGRSFIFLETLRDRVYDEGGLPFDYETAEERTRRA